MTWFIKGDKFQTINHYLLLFLFFFGFFIPSNGSENLKVHSIDLILKDFVFSRTPLTNGSLSGISKGNGSR